MPYLYLILGIVMAKLACAAHAMLMRIVPDIHGCLLAAALVQACWAPRPEDRPDFVQIEPALELQLQMHYKLRIVTKLASLLTFQK